MRFRIKRAVCSPPSCCVCWCCGFVYFGLRIYAESYSPIICVCAVGDWLARLEFREYHFNLVKRCGIRHLPDVKKVKSEDLEVRVRDALLAV